LQYRTEKEKILYSKGKSEYDPSAAFLISDKNAYLLLGTLTPDAS